MTKLKVRKVKRKKNLGWLHYANEVGGIILVVIYTRVRYAGSSMFLFPNAASCIMTGQTPVKKKKPNGMDGKSARPRRVKRFTTRINSNGAE